MNFNRAHAVPLQLLDAGIVNVSRTDMVERMAQDLVRFDSFRCESDAIRSLFGRGYSMVDIVMVIDDARQVAMQDIVAREMSEP